MPEQVVQEPTQTPTQTASAEATSAKVEATTEQVEKHLEKIYKAIGELTEATKALANYIKASEEANRGLIEAVKSLKTELAEEVKKAITAGFEAAAAENKAGEKFKITGSPQVSETGEEVKYPPEQLRERGAEMLEKSREEIKKTIALTPRPEGGKFEGMGKNDSASELIRGILYGNLKPGEIPRRVREVMANV